MSNFWLTLTGFFGATGVALGAFGAHGLRAVLPLQKVTIFETAVRYQLFHTLALLGVVVLLQVIPARKLSLTWAARCFASGIILFSFSLYGYSLTDLGFLRWVTPFGGLALVVGWSLLIVAGWRFSGQVIKRK